MLERMNATEFKTLAVAQMQALFNYAFRLSGNREAAEDLVQSTFDRTLSHWDRFPNKAAVRPMMFRILHNLFVNQVVAEQRRPVMVSLDEWKGGYDLERISVEGEAMTELIRNSLSDEVESALSKLGVEERETLWLRAVGGFAYQEIAEITEVPIGTVRSRLARSRRALAKRLREYARNQGVSGEGAGKRGQER